MTSTSPWTEFARPTPEWFADSPLGIFIHWGAYSVPGWAEPTGELGTVADPQEWMTHNPYAEWYGNTIQIEGSPAQRHHREVWHGQPYDDFLDQWHPDAFDPDAWMELFGRCGAGYVVPTTKHHDGITLWDAPGTGGRNTVQRGPHRDLVAELADAARRHGLRLGLYYSGGLDWHVSGLAPIGADINDEGRPLDRAYADYAFDHCVDLVDRYRPSILWNDIDWPDAGKGTGPKDLPALFRHFREVVPDGLLNDRWGVEFSDYRTSEYQALGESESADQWENCRGIGLSFGWNRVEGPEQYLTGGQLARHLVDVVSRGGHFLLNVGPRPDGTLEPLQVASLEGLASWMQQARPYVVLGGDRHAPDESLDHWERRISQRDGRVAVFLDDAESVEGFPDAVAVSGCRVDGSTVVLDDGRPGPAIVLVDESEHRA